MSCLLNGDIGKVGLFTLLSLQLLLMRVTSTLLWVIVEMEKLKRRKGLLTLRHPRRNRTSRWCGRQTQRPQDWSSTNPLYTRIWQVPWIKLKTNRRKCLWMSQYGLRMVKTGTSLWINQPRTKEGSKFIRKSCNQQSSQSSLLSRRDKLKILSMQRHLGNLISFTRCSKLQDTYG